MGVFDWIGLAELVGLALLAVVVWLVARRRDRAMQGRPGDATNTATVGTPTVVAHHQTDMSCSFGGDAGGV